ncbi:hypothetical protein ACJZ2D_001988 [Fusarium nematophilum]
MAEGEGATIVVGTHAENPPQSDARSSSPLSSIPDPEPYDPYDIPPETPPAASPARPQATTTKPAKTNNTKKRVVVRNAGRRKSKWGAENILTDPKSPLASADLRSILSNPMAWDVLDAEEKAEILALFPDTQYILGSGTEDARPDFASLMNDDSFRYDCAAYTENIAQGRHDPEWLASAWAAHERRKAGDFDEYLENKFREEWDVELPDEFRTRRGPAVCRGDSDTNMEGAQADEGHKNDGDAKMEDVETDQRGEHQKENGVDELQAEDSGEKEQKDLAIGRQRVSSKMDVDGENAEDELA